MRNRSLFLLVALILAVAMTVPMATTTRAQSANIDCKGAQKGDTLSMLYVWSGQEEASLNSVLKPLVDACGIVFKAESSRDAPALLDTKVQAGTPPDIAFPSLATVARYQDKLVALDSLGGDKTAYPDFFI